MWSLWFSKSTRAPYRGNPLHSFVSSLSYFLSNGDYFPICRAPDAIGCSRSPAEVTCAVNANQTNTKTMKNSAIVTLALSVSVWSLTAQEPVAQPASGKSPSPQAAAPGESLSFRLFPPHAQEKLSLSSEQEKQVATLEIDIRSKLGAILTAEQQQQLGRMHPLRRPGPGSGGPGGTGGLGGTGGPSGTGGLGGTGGPGGAAGQGGTGTGPDGQTTGKGSEWGAVTPGHPDPVAPSIQAITGFHIIAPRAQELLALSADQQKQVQALETEVKGKLDTILTPDQELQLEQLRNSPRQSDANVPAIDVGSTGSVAPASSTGSASER